MSIHGAWAVEPISMAGSLIYQAIKIYNDAPETLVVTAEGSGSNREEAIKFALIASTTQAVGALIVSDREVINDKIISDNIIQHSSGVVNHYDVLSCVQENNRYTCKIRATVTTAPLLKELRTGGASVVEVDGKSAYAEQLTTRTSIQEGRRLVFDSIDRMRSSGVDVKIVEAKPVLTDSNLAKFTVHYEVKLNGDYLKSLNDVLSRVSKASLNKIASNGPRLSIDVSSSSVGFFSGSNQFDDSFLVSEVQKRLQKQQPIEIYVQFKNHDDEVIGASCDRYRTLLYGKWNDSQTTLPINGRLAEKRAQLIPIPEDMLPEISTIDARLGCGIIDLRAQVIDEMPVTYRNPLAGPAVLGSGPSVFNGGGAVIGRKK